MQEKIDWRVFRISTPLYQEPTNEAIEVQTDPVAPIFVSSETFKIVGFKESNDKNDTSSFVDVKPEFILNSGDRKAYLGSKRFVIPIYEITPVTMPNVGEVYRNLFDKEYCEVIKVDEDKGFGTGITVKFERAFTLKRFKEQFELIKKSDAS